MPDIDIPYKFDKADAEFIKSKLSSPSFTHQQWSESDLEPIRVKIRQYYRLKQKGKCAYCLGDISMVSASNAHIEHIVPKSLHREFIFNPINLCVICADCNTIKLNQEVTNEIEDTIENGKTFKQYPRSSNAFKIVHPHFDIYKEHILRTGGGYYLDLTRKGHFTIGACRLNRRIQTLGWDMIFLDEPKIIERMHEILFEQDNNKRTQLIYKLKDNLNGI